MDPPAGRPRSPLLIACFAWAMAVTIQLVMQWPAIAALDFSDPDDAMRMAQVRDLLAGQGWWDLHQYRVNPADGGVLMHWSRIVDAPIALGVLILRPLFGQPMAEQVMMALWPAMTAAILFLICAFAFRGLSDRRIAIGAPILLAASAPLMGQFRPLHVDHHGWQVIFAALMLSQAIRPASRQSGILAGLAGAALLAVSIEGLPIVTLFAALAAIRWALNARREDRDRLIGMMGALAMGAALVQFVTRGPASLVDSWCDALSPPYIAAFGAAFLPVAAIGFNSPRSLALRLAMLAAAGLLAAGALVLVAPQCASGPFASLDPVVVRFWYVHILEGRPVWLSGATITAAMIVPALLGLAGSAMAWRAHVDAAERRRWTVIFVALAGATILALLVMRASATAHVFALPGCVWLTLSAWTRARSIGSAPMRMAATAGAVMTLPFTAGVVAAQALQLAFPRLKAVDEIVLSANEVDQMCLKRDAVRALNALPQETVLVPLDLGGPMLFWTHHRLVATGHHRNNKAMADTINAFIGTADQAETVVRRRKATLIVFCRTANDFRYYRSVGRNSLAQRLDAGNPPAWLEPVAIGREYGLSVWRVKPE
ncbi:hypothetical protein [Sphingopyxis sp.]|uniref:hypothetical protein n=1 Tax=Sphingopyxis sp. TaxID=1908224 RepID=UPI002ED7CD9C